MRRAAKVDRNQAEVVKGLRAAGCWVWSTAPLGGGFPDLLVYAPNLGVPQFVLLEVKDGAKPPSARALTPAEREFAEGCPGPVHVVNSLAEALQAVGIFRRQAS